MINLNKIKNLAKDNYHLTSLLKDFTKYEAQEKCLEEVLRINILAKKIAEVGDDLYFEFFKDEN